MVTLRLSQWGRSSKDGHFHKGDREFLSVTRHGLRVLRRRTSAYFYLVGGEIIASVEIPSWVSANIDRSALRKKKRKKRKVINHHFFVLAETMNEKHIVILNIFRLYFSVYLGLKYFGFGPNYVYQITAIFKLYHVRSYSCVFKEIENC